MIPIKLEDISIVDKHYDAIKEFFDTPIRKYKNHFRYKYKDINDWVMKLTDKNYDLEKLIKAKPEEFKKIIKLITENPIYNGEDESMQYVYGSDYSINQYFLYAYKKFSNMKDGHFNKIGYNALDLVNNVGLIICPYCNRNFISHAKKIKATKKTVIRTSQLDHYYPESKYPFLALSFYNLIPVCSSCNKTKLTDDFGVNPYEIQNSDDHLIFDYDFNGSIKNVKINTIYMSKDFEKNWNALGLEELYQAHNTYLSDLLIRIKIYNSLYRNDLSKYLSRWSCKASADTLEITAEDIQRALIGNYYLERNLSKQPLSKLTKDIVRQHL